MNEKKQKLFEDQKLLLDTFLEKKAISRAQYDKSLGDLIRKMGIEQSGAGQLRIRKTEERDLGTVLAIYARARRFMAEHGNPHQWGPTDWPPEALVRSDIAAGESYVCVDETDRPIGVFYYHMGVDPTYRSIEGSWKSDRDYAVVHRIAADGSQKGIGAFCINWAFEQCGHLRMDTRGDNVVMQKLLTKLGFEYCGIIHVEEDEYPRLAYEKESVQR